jgi:ATPase subunit of ABC transporter with duplicated ATPase domains
MSANAVVFSRLSFSWPGESPLFEELSFVVGDGHTGLVAPNGAGKSTLLKLIAGDYRPSAGSVSVDGTVGYLPQTLPFDAQRTVADVLGVAPVREALAALAEGDAREQVFTAIGDDWDIEERSRAQLDRLGLEHVGLDRVLGDLSGGEVISLGLAGELLKRPDVLLLDEPTNNLDADARAKLYDVLDDYSGVLFVVSHDRALLDRMDAIAELRRGEIAFHGGNFTAYEESLREVQRVAESNVRNAEQQLKREKRQMQQARERTARKTNNAARNVKDAGLPKIIAGAMKRRAQESAGRIDGVNAARVDEAKTRLDDAERTLRDDPSIVLDLPETEVPTGRNVFTANGLRLGRGGRQLLGDGIDLSIRGPERIALVGPNGSGKTTLLHVIAGHLEPDAGSIQRADGRIAYLSQRLDLLDDDRTVLESLIAYAPNLSETRRMHLLAQFLFRGNRVHLPVAALSGGERLRATLACVLFAEPAPQLLLLDEPTNNLDLDSVAQLESALNAYRGAFVVVSHDAKFLDNIRIDRTIRLGAND